MPRLSRWTALPLLVLLPACAAESPSAPALQVEESAAFSRQGAMPANRVLMVLNTQLTAEAEVPHTSDSQARGHAQIKIHPGGRITWKGRINNPAGERFTMGHIHFITNPNRTGGVVLWLFDARPAGGDTGRHIDFEGEAVNQTLADALMANPSAYYVNFHTTTIPPGAVRGDL